MPTPACPRATRAPIPAPRSAGARPRAWAVLAAACLALGGCMAHADMTITPAGTYDVTLDLRDSTGTVFAPSTPASERCTALADPSIVGGQAGTRVSATPVGSAGEDDGVGCRIVITGVAVPDAAASPSADSSPGTTGVPGSADTSGDAAADRLVVREGDLYVVDLSAATELLTGTASLGQVEEGTTQGGSHDGTGKEPGEAAASSEGADQGAEDPTAPAGSSADGGDVDDSPDSSLDSSAAQIVSQAVDVHVSVTFPGAVVDAGGGTVASSGRTVTWDSAKQAASGLTATGYASERTGLGWWARYRTHVLVGVVAACAAAAGGVVYRWRRAHGPRSH